MRAVVAVDSVYGNTRKVAECIAAELIAAGNEAELILLRDCIPSNVKGDILFIGSPTRWGRMTGRAKKFVIRIDEADWKGKNAIAFDTIMVPEKYEKAERGDKWTANGAAPKLARLLKEKGLAINERMLRVEVTGLKGPLIDDYRAVVLEFLRSNAIIK